MLSKDLFPSTVNTGMGSGLPTCSAVPFSQMVIIGDESKSPLISLDCQALYLLAFRSIVQRIYCPGTRAIKECKIWKRPEQESPNPAACALKFAAGTCSLLMCWPKRAEPFLMCWKAVRLRQLADQLLHCHNGAPCIGRTWTVLNTMALNRKLATH